MAAIDAALEGPFEDETEEVETDSPLAPHAAPGVDPRPIPGLSADQKRAMDPKRQALRDAQTDLERQANQITAEQEEQENAFNRTANRTANAAGKIWRGTGLTLESIPTPGSLAFPLIVLFVFFVLLLPVNGHTRLMWLWLTLTGNASVLGDSGASVTTGGSAVTPPSETLPGTGTTTPPSESLPLAAGLALARTITGVEGALL